MYRLRAAWWRVLVSIVLCIQLSSEETDVAIDHFMHYSVYGSEIANTAQKKRKENKRKFVLKTALILLIQQRSM
jgi:hypothetical protein